MILDALFKSQTDTRSVDSLFLQYLVSLAFDFKSTLYLPKLLFFLRYIQFHPSSFQASAETINFYEPLLYVALSKSLDLWPLAQINSLSNPAQVSISSSNKQPDMNKTIIVVFVAILSDCLRIDPPPSKQKIRAFSSFLLAFSHSGHANAIIGCNKDFYGNEVKRFEEVFMKFCARLSEIEPTVSSELQKEYSLVFGKGMAMAAADSFGKPSRVFWLIWLDSMMKFRKLQPASFRNELEYFFLTESAPSIISDLIATSFDLIAVSINRKDSQSITQTWKNFLIKRVPQIIKSLVITSKPSTPPAQIELAISQALLSLPKDTQTCIQSFLNPGNSNIDDMFLSTYQTPVQNDLRFTFLKALIALGVVPSTSLVKVLGIETNQALNMPIIKVNDELLKTQGLIVDTSNPLAPHEYSLPNIVPAAKVENVGNVAFEDSNILKLVTIFDNLEGVYQEAVAREIFHLSIYWIESMNTQNLRRLVQTLLYKPSVMDTLFLHIPMGQFIGPMAQLLENWKHEEDEVNMQDIYNDFGSILLFIIFLYQRYNLDLTDLGIQPPPVNLGAISRPGYTVNNNNEKPKLQPPPFVVTAIRQAGTAKIIDDLSPEKSELVGGWLSALFDEGMIPDELINKSPPKDLFELVPTILSQAVAACVADVIDFDTLKGGLEFFRQSFLIPTLVPAIRCICNNIWSENEIQILLRVLDNLLLSESSGVDQILLETVLAVTGQELLYMINAINLRTDGDPEGNGYIVEPRLLSLLEHYYTGVPPTDYILNQKDSLANLVKKQISDLAKWSPSESLPPAFHGELFYTTVREVGATNALLILLDHIEAAKKDGMGSATVDVVTAITTVPSLGKSKTYFQRYDSNILKTIIDFQPAEIAEIRGELKARGQIQREAPDTKQQYDSIKGKNSRTKSVSGQNASVKISTAASNGKTGTVQGINTDSNDQISKTEAELAAGFVKLKQAVQTFHGRRRNMESIITRRASQAQAQIRTNMATSRVAVNANGATNSIGNSGGGAGYSNIGPGDINSPEVYRQQQYNSTQPYRHQKGF